MGPAAGQGGSRGGSHGTSREVAQTAAVVLYVQLVVQCDGHKRARGKGPGQRDIDPFYGQIDHASLGIVETVDDEKDLVGFVDRLRKVPDHVVVAKQRAIEAVRHKLLYDMSGSREDAFTCMLRQLIPMLASLPSSGLEDDRRAPLTLPPR